MGYSNFHATDVYQVLDTSTNKVKLTRNVRWLKVKPKTENSNNNENISKEEIIVPKTIINKENSTLTEEAKENPTLRNELQRMNTCVYPTVESHNYLTEGIQT